MINLYREKRPHNALNSTIKPHNHFSASQNYVLRRALRDLLQAKVAENKIRQGKTCNPYGHLMFALRFANAQPTFFQKKNSRKAQHYTNISIQQRIYLTTLVTSSTLNLSIISSKFPWNSSRDSPLDNIASIAITKNPLSP